MIELLRAIWSRRQRPSPGRGGGAPVGHDCQNWPGVPRPSVARPRTLASFVAPPTAGRTPAPSARLFRLRQCGSDSTSADPPRIGPAPENLHAVVPRSRRRRSHRLNRPSDRPSRREGFPGQGAGLREVAGRRLLFAV